MRICSLATVPPLLFLIWPLWINPPLELRYGFPAVRVPRPVVIMFSLSLPRCFTDFSPFYCIIHLLILSPILARASTPEPLSPPPLVIGFHLTFTSSPLSVRGPHCKTCWSFSDLVFFFPGPGFPLSFSPPIAWLALVDHTTPFLVSSVSPLPWTIQPRSPNVSFDASFFPKCERCPF